MGRKELVREILESGSSLSQESLKAAEEGEKRMQSDRKKVKSETKKRLKVPKEIQFEIERALDYLAQGQSLTEEYLRFLEKHGITTSLDGNRSS